MRKSVEQYCDTAAIKKTISYRMNFNRVSFDRVFKAITHFHKSQIIDQTARTVTSKFLQ